MGKYYLVFKNSIQKAVVYRFNTFAMLLVQLISFGMFFYLWSAIYRDGGQVGAYSIKGILTYYLLTILVGMVIRGSFIAWAIGDEIRLGSITNYLLKPINYFWYKMFDAFGNTLYRIVIYFGSGLIIFLLFHNYLDFSMNLERLIYFVLFISLGVVLHLMFFYLVGISGFWLDSIQGFAMSMHMVVSFLAGSLIPLDLLPNFVTRLNDFLPFKYMIFFPVSIFNGRIDLSPSLFISPLIWVFILSILSIIIFKRGIKKYEGYGA